MAGTLARLASTVPDLPPLLAPLARSAQRRMVKSYLDEYRKHSALPEERLPYYEAFWTLNELVWSGEHLRKGERFDGRIERRWLLPEAIQTGAERVRAATGVTIDPQMP